jgi:opacity protein-like surface antigen
MKKLIAIAASAALCMAMAVPAAWAEGSSNSSDYATVADSNSYGNDASSLNTSETLDVNVHVKTSDNNTIAKKYKVDLAWDSMDFTYQFTTASTLEWSTENHEYNLPATSTSTASDASVGAWVEHTAFYVATDSDQTTNAGIKVTNHSNDEVNVKASFDGKSTLTNSRVTATITTFGSVKADSNDSLKLVLPSAEGLETDADLVSGQYNVKVEGQPNTDTCFQLGTITVSFTGVTPAVSGDAEGNDSEL